MKIQELAGKKVCILGFGKDGQATLGALKKYAPDAHVVVTDKDDNLLIRDVETKLGSRYLDGLDEFDVIIKSPGVKPDLLTATHPIITSSLQIFLDSIASKHLLTIGVTGSKGKSTTSSLIYSILKQAGKDTYLIGNIGEPVLDYLERAQDGTVFVLEVSSYQLLTLTSGFPIAVVTAIFPEHLDYHGSFESYLAAKKQIALLQSKDDIIFYNKYNTFCQEIADASAGRKIPFSYQDLSSDIETSLRGKHNRSNIAAAYQVATFLGITEEIIKEAVRNFKGLPHRLETIGTESGITWIDDSISTTPESTIAAIESFGSDLSTVIVGGQDRGYDFSKMVDIIFNSNIQTVLLLPDTGEKIHQEFNQRGSNRSTNLIDCSSMDEAVQAAKAHTKEGGICLLSPGAPSYNMYKNFEDRARVYKEAIYRNNN